MSALGSDELVRRLRARPTRTTQDTWGSLAYLRAQVNQRELSRVPRNESDRTTQLRRSNRRAPSTLFEL